MTENKHKVSTDALETLGTILDETAGRDAIHLAVEPVIAGEKLYPAQHIRLENGKAYANGKTFGVVDPFLTGPVYEGQRFWFVIYPRQISSLRHVWEHPLFPASADAVAATAAPMPVEGMSGAEAWLRKFAEEQGYSYNKLIADASRWLGDNDTRFEAGTGIYSGHDLVPEFWDNFKTVTGWDFAEDNNNFGGDDYRELNCCC